MIRASVVGGMNLDVIGAVKSTLIAHDSNPGEVYFSAGGVGRNIAEQLANAGAQTRLFTCLSDDFAGRMLESDCTEKKLDLTFARRVHGRASCYVSLHAPDGDMALAVNDMALMDELTVSYLSGVLSAINQADVCVLDANLSPECLAFLAENVRVPMVADPVSCHKAEKLKPVFSRLAAFKPNLIEAQMLTGEADAPRAARKLLEMGVKRVIISLGAEGAYYADAAECGFLAPMTTFTCQANGAGDAMCAGIALGVAQDLSARGCAENGMARSTALLAARV